MDTRTTECNNTHMLYPSAQYEVCHVDVSTSAMYDRSHGRQTTCGLTHFTPPDPLGSSSRIILALFNFIYDLTLIAQLIKLRLEEPELMYGQI